MLFVYFYYMIMIMLRNPLKNGNVLPGGTKRKIKNKPNLIFLSIFEYKVL